MRNGTMRRNSLRGMAVLLCLLLAALTAGCQLAQQEAAAGEDRLVGVFVTLEPLDLFDFAAYAQDHPAWLLSGGGEIGREETAAYGGRLYAAREEDGCGWRFPETAGYAMFLYTDESEHGSVTASWKTRPLPSDWRAAWRARCTSCPRPFTARTATRSIRARMAPST